MIETLAAVTKCRGSDWELKAVTLDEPQNDEVLVRIVATGLCHTDVSVRDQHLPVPLPAVLGHEGAGVVEKVGAAVTEYAQVRPAARIGVNPPPSPKASH